MINPSRVRLSNRSNGAPLSTASTSLRHCSRVAAGKSAESERLSSCSDITSKCHGRPVGPTWQAVQMMCRAGPLSLCQLFYALGTDQCERVAYPDAGDDAIGRDLGERRQNKAAIEHVGMGLREIGVVQLNVVVSEDVEVDRARSPMALAGGVASKRAFGRFCTGQ